MTRSHAAFVIVVVATLAGCSTTTPDPEETYADCGKPLDEWCDGTCPDRAGAEAVCADYHLQEGTEAACDGGSRYACGSGLWGFTFFFDEAGALLGVLVWSDAGPYCGPGELTIEVYGEQLSCG